jgi:hypothetical protein
MYPIPVLAFNISAGSRGGTVTLAVGIVVIVLLILFAREFGRGTRDSATTLLRGIRRRRHLREHAAHHAHGRAREGRT